MRVPLLSFARLCYMSVIRKADLHSVYLCRLLHPNVALYILNHILSDSICAGIWSSEVTYDKFRKGDVLNTTPLSSPLMFVFSIIPDSKCLYGRSINSGTHICSKNTTLIVSWAVICHEGVKNTEPLNVSYFLY